MENRYRDVDNAPHNLIVVYRCTGTGNRAGTGINRRGRIRKARTILPQKRDRAVIIQDSRSIFHHKPGDDTCNLLDGISIRNPDNPRLNQRLQNLTVEHNILHAAYRDSGSIR